MIGEKYIFDTMEEIIEYLKRVDSGEIVDKRWVIFDFNHMDKK